MTREDYINKQGTLLASIRSNIQDYNVAYGEKRYDDVATINAAIEKDVDEYNSISQMLCFDACSKAENPMHAAIITLHFPVIGIKDTMIGDEVKILKRVIVGDPDAEDAVLKYKQIDLLKFQKYVKDREGHGIGHEANWNNQVERLNLLFALDCAVEIGKGQEFIDEMRDCYAVKEASREIDFGVKNPKAGTPISNTGLLKAVKAVVTAMAGPEVGDKVLTHDVRFLKIVSAKKSRKELAVQCANHRFMRGYLMEVCNRIMTDGIYDVDYKRIKK